MASRLACQAANNVGIFGMILGFLQQLAEPIRQLASQTLP
jgi:hypothetical protein